MIQEGFVFPLSFAQQRLWFLDQLERGSGVYNLAVARRLRGPLNLVALEQSFNEIVRRHEVLRTAFSVSEDEPVQVIIPSLQLTLQVTDLSSLPRERRESESLRLASEEAQRPFDLAQAPLLRVAIARLGKDEHVLLLTMHHSVSDGWSLEILFQELSTLYRAFCEAKPSPLAELLIQYADFTVWQREWLQGETLEAQLSYWRKQLDNASSLLELPTDFPRPAAQTYKGGQESAQIPESVSDGLKMLCQAENVTLFMLILAAFKTLLHRYSGQDDVVVGTAIAGRNRPEVEKLIGFFVNTLVLRTDLSGNPTFREVLGRVRAMALQAYAHQDLPFERLVEELRPERDLSRTPLFNVFFNMFSFERGELELWGLVAEPLKPPEPLSKFDLTLYATEKSGKIGLRLVYNADLFCADRMKQMLEHLQILLQSVVADSNQRLWNIPLLTDAEQLRFLVEWNDTSTPYPENQCVQELFEAQAERTPDALALICDEERLTYRELNQRANQLAHYLRKQGVGPESLVGIAAERCLDTAVGILGILKAGGAYVPLDPEYPRDRLAFMLQDTQTTLLLTRQKFLRALPEIFGCGQSDPARQNPKQDAGAVGEAKTSSEPCDAPQDKLRRRIHDRTVICLDSDWQAIAQEPEINPVNTTAADNLAYVTYTSGSTGKPKGVLTRHRGVVNYFSFLIRAYNLDGTDGILQLPSLSFDASVRDLLGPLTAGARVVIVKGEAAKDPAALLAKIAAERVTCLLSVVPTLLTGLVEAGARGSLRYDWVRLVLVSGEVLTMTACQKAKELFPRALIVNQYGPTECTMTCSYHPVLENENGRAIVALGKPIPNARIYILDRYLNLVPPGVPGEVYLGGVGLARGYLTSPALTAERFIPDPFSTKWGARLYKTGDLARRGFDGDMDFLGRIDHQVKVRGFRIELEEIETVLSQHPSIKQNVVVTRADEGGSPRLAAYAVRNRGADLSSNELEKFLRKKVPDYMVPSTFVFLDELPLTPNRKVDRRALSDPRQPRGAKEKIFTAPRSLVEKAIAEIWRDILRLAEVSVADNFFELGGHSLQVAQIISRLRSTFQVELPVRRLFDRPTLADLAACIEEQLCLDRRHETPTPSSISRPGELPLSFAQERLWFLEQLAPLNPLYNIPAALRLIGQLDLVALNQSLNAITSRHEVLRTSFSSVAGRPLQAIAPALTLAVPVVDLSSKPQAEREVETLRLATEEARRAFDLTRGPLFRVVLLRLGNEEHILLLTMHHIVSDGWSLNILFRELSALYNAFLAGQPSSLSELPIQYADFALRQRHWLQGETLEREVAYWKQRLEGAPSLLLLPTDRPRPAAESFHGATLSVVFSTTLTDGLNELSSHNGVSLFMTLLAAFTTLLYRYTGQDDIVVGSPVANRNRGEIEELIGYFVNVLALRVDLSGNPTFTELLKRLRDVAVEAYEHQEVPFDKLVEELQPERDLSRNPLFQVMFAMQMDSRSALNLSGLRSSVLNVDRGTSKFDLTLHMAERKDGLRGTVEYNTDLFDHARIKRMLDHWRTLLEGIVAQPTSRLSDLPVLTENERDQLLREWNNTNREYAKDQCICELFEAQVERTPEAVAVVFENQQMTYRELNTHSNHVAHYLSKLGVRPDVLVGVCMERTPEMVIALVGILKVGGAYVPLDPEYPKERLAFILEDTRLRVLVTQQNLARDLPAHGAHEICLDRDWGEVSCQPGGNYVCPELAPENLAYVLYTSGSTGKSKGIAIKHSSPTALVSWAHSVFTPENLTGVLASTSICFDLSVFELFVPLTCGGKVILAQNALTLPTLRSASEVVLINTVPSAMAELLRIDGIPPSVRTINLAGEPLQIKLVKEIYETTSVKHVYDLYGPSEDTTYSTFALRTPTGPETIGRPISNTQLYILDRHLNPLPIGIPGELYISGHGLARGYFNRPELTAEKFIPHPFSTAPGALLYNTGDLARYLPDGNIEFLGRSDYQVKIRGFRIEPGEIAAALRQHPAVRETVVMAREDKQGDKRLVAYVLPQLQLPAVDELRAFLRKKLPVYMIPCDFVELNAVPLTPNGKIDRNALPTHDEPKPQTDGSSAPPRTPLEESLAKIWVEMLRLTRVGVNDNFFELGGHSLKAMELISKISATVGIDLSVRLLFTHPTIASLADTINRLAPSYPADGARQVEPHKTPIAPSGFVSGRPHLDPGMIMVERRPLLSLFAAGKIAPVDAAAVGYLSNEIVGSSGLDRNEIIHGWYGDLPGMTTVLETSWGRIAIIILPRFAAELYTDQETLIEALLEALEMAGRLGARVVSLTGLIPSATDYGRAVAATLAGRKDLPAVSTGHATTVATVVLAIARTLREGARDLARERVGFLGLGSIGLSTLELMLRCLPHPSEILLCDIYGKRGWMMEVERRIRRSGFLGSLRVLESSGNTPAEFYDASLIVGATNVPEILDITKVNPGSMIVDDSAPHCFVIKETVARFGRDKDILFTEGGVLSSSDPIRRVRHLPRLVEEKANRSFVERFWRHHPFQITGCVLSGLLSSCFGELRPTVGLVDTNQAFHHYEQLEKLGFQAAELHCDEFVLPKESVRNFRQRFGYV